MSNVINVNFEGVESGGFSKPHVPEGDYLLKVKKVQQKKGKDSGAAYLLFFLRIVSGNPKGINKDIPHTCSLTKNSLWNLRNLLEASGKTIPAKAIKIDLDKLVNLEMGATLVDEEYEGKKYSVVGAFFPKSELNAVSNEETEAEPTEEAEEPAGEEEGEELFD